MEYRDRDSTRQGRAEEGNDPVSAEGENDNLVQFTEGTKKEWGRRAPAFTSETAREAARRSNAKQKENAAARAAGVTIEQIKAIQTAGLERALTEQYEPTLLGKAAELIALQMASMILAGKVGPRSAAEATKVGEAWNTIARLTKGEPSKITASSDDERREAFQALMRNINDRKSG